MESFSFVGRDKRHAQDLNSDASAGQKQYGADEANRVSAAIQALPDGAKEVRVQVRGSDVRVTYAAEDGSRVSDEAFPGSRPEVVTSDGVRHSAKDQLEHPIGAATPGIGPGERSSPVSDGAATRSAGRVPGVAAPERVTSDGVRHTAKDDREHGFGAAGVTSGVTERRTPPAKGLSFRAERSPNERVRDDGLPA